MDTITVPGFRMGHEMLGPDDKIYISCLTSYPIFGYMPHRQSLSVINNPDAGGAGYNFAPFSFNLNGGETCGGLPTCATQEKEEWSGK